ncbi:alpha/beta fold hydrolase [Gordonia liuliyuniae]|uniref:Alpha/beta hydrolase n=1 Tax=Gordonia liuliyuniae TaxID=2911517 RepID=A0ABS9IP21_9ACTN|nr:alpha/beta hydrolase [Gordonia liuliyuniae]MCF8587287.1 alpha/beta hydrolase [Gordonia liuliyuniae]
METARGAASGAKDGVCLRRSLEVDGAEIRYDVRGSGDLTLVLVHGHQAHHAWWHSVERELSANWRVALLDLSGHGDSGHRDSYGGDVWVREVLAVVEASTDDRVVLVGHSMGGRIALAAAAATRSSRICGVIMFDSAVPLDGPPRVKPWDPDRAPRLFQSREEATARFRLMPPQPEVMPEIWGPLVGRSIREVPGGWTWKHDQRGLPAFVDEFGDSLNAVDIPVSYMWGTESRVVGPATVDYIRANFTVDQISVVEMQGVHHHMILEAPARCAFLVDRFVRGLVAERGGDMDAETPALPRPRSNG